MSRTTFNMTNLFPESFATGKKRLSERPDILRSFEKIGIKPDSVRKLVVWLTEDWKVFFPLYGGDNKDSFEISGVIYFNEYLEAWVIHITKWYKWAYLGVDLPNPEYEAIVVQDPFEWMRLWQEGYNNVWCIPDYSKRPPSYKYWSRINFVHDIDDETISHFRECPLATFELDLPFMEGRLPENAESRSRSVISNAIMRNPFQIMGKNFILVRNGMGKYIIDQDLNYYKASANRGNDYAISVTHPYVGEILVNKSIMITLLTSVVAQKSERDVFKDLYDYIEGNLYFFTELQALILTTEILYLWRSYQDSLPYSFQILCKNEMWLQQIMNVVYPILPHGAVNSGTSNIPSIMNTERVDRSSNIFGSHIYLSHVEAWQFWYGLPMFIDYYFGNKDLRKYRNKSDAWLREKLLAYAVQFHWPDTSDLPMKLQWMRPFELVLRSMYTKATWTRKIKTIADIFEESRKRCSTLSRNDKYDNFNFFSNQWLARNRLQSSRKSKTTSAKKPRIDASASMQDLSPSDDDGWN